MVKKLIKDVLFKIGDVFSREISPYTNNLYKELENYMGSCEPGKCKGYLFLIYKNKRDFNESVKKYDLKPLTEKDREEHTPQSALDLKDFLIEKDFKIKDDYKHFFEIVGHHEPEGFDGALALTKNGKYLGSSWFIQGVRTRKKKTYNVPVVSINPDLIEDLKDVISFEPGKGDEESSGARHIAAQYASKNKLIQATIAGSEKHGEVTLFIDGIAQDLYKE